MSPSLWNPQKRRTKRRPQPKNGCNQPPPKCWSPAPSLTQRATAKDPEYVKAGYKTADDFHSCDFCSGIAVSKETPASQLEIFWISSEPIPEECVAEAATSCPLFRFVHLPKPRIIPRVVKPGTIENAPVLGQGYPFRDLMRHNALDFHPLPTGTSSDPLIHRRPC
jgi:hypothetical protein